MNILKTRIAVEKLLFFSFGLKLWYIKMTILLILTLLKVADSSSDLIYACWDSFVDKVDPEK